MNWFDKFLKNQGADHEVVLNIVSFVFVLTFGYMALTIYDGNVANSQASIGSSQLAAVSSTPGVAVSSPNGGETWPMGTVAPIQWLVTGLNQPKCAVDLYKVGSDSPIKTIVADLVSNGSGYITTYSWKIPTDLSSGHEYKILVRCAANGGNTTYADQSDNYFAIVNSSPTPTPTPRAGIDFSLVSAKSRPVSPAAKTDFELDVTIKNNSNSSVTGTALPTTRLNIYNADGTRVYSVGTGYPGGSSSVMPAHGSKTFTFKSSLFNPPIELGKLNFPAGTYKVVSDVITSDGSGDSNPGNNSLTTYVSVVATPTIQVVAPNGGESYGIGSIVPIQIITNGPQGSLVFLDLYKVDTTSSTGLRFVTRISADGVNPATFSWKIPSSIRAGDYKIYASLRASGTNKLLVGDMSDNSFKILVSTKPCVKTDSCLPTPTPINR